MQFNGCLEREFTFKTKFNAMRAIVGCVTFFSLAKARNGTLLIEQHNC